MIESNVELRKNAIEDTLELRRVSNEESTEGHVRTIEDYLQDLENKPSVEIVSSTLVELKNILILRNCHSDANVITKGIPIVYKTLCETTDTKMIIECLWALTNMCFYNNGGTHFLSIEGSLDKIQSLLYVPALKVRKNCLWLIGNVMGESPTNCSAVIKHGFIRIAYECVCKETDDDIVNVMVWIFSNMVDPLLMKTVLDLEYWNMILHYSCWIIQIRSRDNYALAFHNLLTISAVNSDLHLYILDNIPMVYIFELVKDFQCDKSSEIQGNIWHLIGHILSNESDETTQILLDFNISSVIKDVYYKIKNKALQKDLLWCISNIAAGTLHQKKVVFDQGLIDVAFDGLRQSKVKLILESVWTIRNLVHDCSPDQFKIMIGYPWVSVFVQILSSSKNIELMCLTMKTLKQIFDASKMFYLTDEVQIMFKEDGGCDLLEKLQAVDNNEISSLSRSITEEYFSNASFESEDLGLGSKL